MPFTKYIRCQRAVRLFGFLWWVKCEEIIPLGWTFCPKGHMRKP